MSNATLIDLSKKITEASKVIVSIPDFVESLKSSMPVSEQVTQLAVSESQYNNEKLCQEYIWRRLGKLGVYNDDTSHEILMSEDCTEKDARRVFCENGEPNLPPARFKRVWSILKNADVKSLSDAKADIEATGTPPEDHSDLYSNLKKGLKDLGSELASAIQKPFGQWKDKELLEAYGIDCDAEIIRVLAERSNGRAFVVFADEENAKIDLETSLRMLREARRRETPVNYRVADALKRLYVAGEFPNMFYIESPFYKGTLLIDGYCDESKLSWNEVPYECMQFARLAMDLGEAPTEKPGQRQFIQTALQQGIDGLGEDYSETALEFRERKAEDSLPNLRVRFSTKPNSAVADPFKAGNHRF